MTAEETRAEEPVLTLQEGPVLTVTINRPQRKNALDERAWGELYEALHVARSAEDVRVVVITGAGGDFCAGADLGGEQRDRHPLDRMRWIGDIAMALHDMPMPVVAKVEGVAVGAGWNLALGADLVVASTTARFSQIFVRRGLSLDFGGSWLLPRIVGLQQAKRLALLADFIDAEEALRLGLVTWVKAPAYIDEFVDELARRLAEGPPVAMALSKSMLNRGAAQSLREALENESGAQVINFGTDAPEARRAFLAKADARFDGRWQVGRDAD